MLASSAGKFPDVQDDGGVSAFFVSHRGHKYASSVLMGPITEAFVVSRRGLTQLLVQPADETGRPAAGLGVYLYPGSVRYLWLDRARRQAQKKRPPAR